MSIAVEEDVLGDLRARLRATRWPRPPLGRGWERGTDATYLRALVDTWVDGFDWRARERELSRFDHFTLEIEGLRIHFVHASARSGRGIPLVLTHGWPSSFLEFLGLVPLLTDPEAHGIPGPAFDLVIPSLPGYVFSERPSGPLTVRDTARIWHRLMRGLGYERYAAHGGDFGAGVATFMALDDPSRMLGIHLTDIDIPPYTGPGSRPLSPAEREYLEAKRAWDETERGYGAIQSTKPQTLAISLGDSPAGLAAWVIEKWRSWSDSRGELDRRLPRDLLLANLTLYWVTDTIRTSILDYYDDRWHRPPFGPDDRVRVRTAFAVFAHHFVTEGTPPREWAERLYDIRRWTVMPRGGHFPAIEEPDLLARDIAAFFSETR